VVKLRKLAEKYADLEALIDGAEDSEETVQRLLGYLADPSEAVRMMACRACRRFCKSERLLDKLLTLADEDTENEVRYEALRALGGIIFEGDLWAAAEADYERETKSRIEALFRKTRSYLEELLQDPGRSAYERYGAVEALGALGGEDWVAPLIGALWYSGEDKAKLSALMAITASCDKRWTRLVLDALGEKKEVLLRKALMAAGALRLVKAEDLICRVALARKKSKALRRAAFQALAGLDTKRSRRVLTKIARNGKDRLCDEARGRVDELAFSHKLLPL
jgi:hypothetical protein